MKESTRPLDHEILYRSVGFRSPWLVRVRLWLASLVGLYRWADYRALGVEAFGYERDGVFYFTRVNRP